MHPPPPFPLMNTTRRRFLFTASAAALGAPSILHAKNDDRVIGLGHIGVGGRGTVLLKNYQSREQCRSVAICDPFRQRRGAAGQVVRKAHGHEPVLYNDYRELLADPKVDAVVIATADHWHVPIALEAVKAGKHVYLEKPLGYTMEQNRALEAELAKTELVFQYGTQQRGTEILHRGIEQVLNGTIGEIERIECWAPKGAGGGSLEEIPVPEGLDYDLYLGPAPKRPCTRDRITSKGSWYCRDYALGFIAGWGAHPLDIAVWGCDFDQSGPFTIEGTGNTPTPDGLFNAVASWDTTFRYPNGVEMRFMSSDVAKPVVATHRDNWEGDGTTFFGSKGFISLSRSSVAATDREWFRAPETPHEKQVPYHPNWYQAFIDTILGKQQPVGPIGDAVRSDAMSHLALKAIESDKPITWDPKELKIVN